eukprot:SAG31_NODE_608_length_13576_cov_23.757290_2_plen_324_part_00
MKASIRCRSAWMAFTSVLACLILCGAATYLALWWVELIPSPRELVTNHKEHNGLRRVVGPILGIHELVPRTPDTDAQLLEMVLNATACEAFVRLGNLQRGNADGGWNVCADGATGERWPPQDCLVYSFGSNLDFSFDVSAARLGCEVHVFDPTISAFPGSEDERRLRDAHPSISIHLLGLANRAQEPNKKCAKHRLCAYSLATFDHIRRRLGHEHRRIDIVKMDIEGSEWSAVRQMLDVGALHGVEQLLMEVHFLRQDRCADIGHESCEADDKANLELLRRIREDRGAGFVLWSRDENVVHSVARSIKGVVTHICQELSYVRR